LHRANKPICIRVSDENQGRPEPERKSEPKIPRLKMAKVAYTQIKYEHDGVYLAVRWAMELADWETSLKTAKTLFVKINAVSDEVLPGRNTSPWVFESVLRVIRSKYPQLIIYVGDSDCAGSRQLWRSMKAWGYKGIAEKYGCKTVNLSDMRCVNVKIGGARLSETVMPQLLLDVDAIVNIPVLKTHILTGITCCLKNHWGLLPRMRHQYHLHVNEVIAELNSFFKKTVFNIVDASVCIEGPGPKTGITRITDVIVASRDRVAADAFCARLIGFASLPLHIQESEKKGVGSAEYEVVGDRPVNIPFKKPDLKGDVVGLLEYKCRRTPVVSQLVFKTPLFKLMAFAGTNYNRLWYAIRKWQTKRYILKNRFYRQEFKDIF
jgi:uncharacterized protein (DUF362 family)